MLTPEMYLDAVAGVAELSLRSSLSKKEEIRLGGLMAIAAQGKHLFKPSEIAEAQRDLMLRQAGLPRAGSNGSRRGFLDDPIEREYRNFGLGREVRLTHVPDDLEARANVENPPAPSSISYGQTAGRFVPWNMYSRVLETMKLADQLYEPWANLTIETTDGNPTSVPVVDDVAAQASQISEATQSSQSQITNFAQVQLGAWTFRTLLVVISLELLQDSNYPWPMVLERVFAGQLSRGIGQSLVNGNGVNGPTGLVTAAIATGNVSVANGAGSNDGGAETGSTSVGSDDLVNAMGKLNPAYWSRAIWTMNPQTLLTLWGQKDKQGRPLVENYLSGNSGPISQAPYVLGKRVAISPSMPTLAKSDNSIVLFDPDYFIFRTVPSSMYIRRFHELPGLVENGLVGFQAFLRVDSNLASPNTSFPPCVVIQNHS